MGSRRIASTAPHERATIAIQPLRPFVITSKREQLREGVFRPGWRLPTMSIDEYLEQERARGNIIEGGG